MRGYGAPLEQLGVVYILGVFWIIKFLWAPLVDSIHFGRFGQYRTWLLLMQGGMLLILLLIGQCRLPEHFFLVVGLGILHSLLSATQDIASDALTYTLLLPSERATGTSVQMAGGLLGNIVGGGLILMAYPYVGWSGCSSLLAGTVALCFLQVLFFREPVNHPIIRLSGGMKRLITFWGKKRHQRWLLLLVCYGMGLGMVWGIVPPMLTDRGWPLARIGFTMNIAGSLVSMLGAALSGKLVRCFGRKRMLVAASVCIISSLAGITMLLSVGATNFRLLQAAVLLFYAGMSPAIVILPTLMLDHTSSESPATDYTMQFCVSTAIQYISAAMSTMLAGIVGYTNIVVIGIVIEFSAFLLALRFTPLENTE
jgi:MFS family permease